MGLLFLKSSPNFAPDQVLVSFLGLGMSTIGNTPCPSMQNPTGSNFYPIIVLFLCRLVTHLAYFEALFDMFCLPEATKCTEYLFQGCVLTLFDYHRPPSVLTGLVIVVFDKVREKLLKSKSYISI